MSNVNNLLMTDGTTTAKIFEFIDLNGACSNLDILQSVPNINSNLLAILGSTATTADSYRFCVKNFRQKFQTGPQVTYIKNSPVPCSVEIPNEATGETTFRTFLLRTPGYVIEIYNNDKIKFIPVEYYKEITPVIFESGATITNADELKRIYNMLSEGVIPTYKFTDRFIYDLHSYMCIKAGSAPLTSSIADFVKMSHGTSGTTDQLILRFFVYSSNAFTEKTITISFSGSTLNTITVP